MEIYQDYAKLREDIGKLQKNATNPHFKNTYVTLNAVLEAVDGYITKHNFVCYIQRPTVKDSKNYLLTELIHNTGERLSCELELLTTRTDPQMLGSSLTYARRYSLITLLGLQAEDDDGNVASGLTKPTEVDLANETQLQEIRKLATQKGSSLSSIIKHYGVAGLPKLTFVMAKDCINQLKTKKDI